MVVVTPLPARRTDLVIKPLGDDGRYVVKDSRTGEFFQLGQREHFLLTNLDGVQIVDDVCADYEAQFGEPLPPGELDAFVEVIRAQGLLEPTTESASTAQSLPVSTQPGAKSILHWRTPRGRCASTDRWRSSGPSRAVVPACVSQSRGR